MSLLVMNDIDKAFNGIPVLKKVRLTANSLSEETSSSSTDISPAIPSFPA